MANVKIIDSTDSDEFENKLNDFLSAIKEMNLIDIKYSTNLLNVHGSLIYSALVIYE